jgi:hypothetical protein
MTKGLDRASTHSLANATNRLVLPAGNPSEIAVKIPAIKQYTMNDALRLKKQFSTNSFGNSPMHK